MMLSTRTILIRNNLRAFAIHGVVLAIYLVIAIPFGFAGWLIASIPALIGYVFFAYKFLIPLPKGNFLSVSGIALLFLAIFGAVLLYSTLSSAVELGFFGIINMPAFEVMGLLFRVVGISDISRSLWAVEALCAAIIPSWLMYSGLCLKASTEKPE